MAIAVPKNRRTKPVTAKPILHIVTDAAPWRQVTGLNRRLQRAVTAAQASLPKKDRLPCHATLLLTSDAAIKKLNHDFRGLNQPTNVLSFPQYPPEALPRRTKTPVELGDIVIAYRYTKAEADREDKKFINHLSHLAIHGFLHLFGYDHRDDRQASMMENLETAIMQRLGLPDPYAEAPVVPRRRKTSRSPATIKRKS